MRRSGYYSEDAPVEKSVTLPNMILALLKSMLRQYCCGLGTYYSAGQERRTPHAQLLRNKAPGEGHSSGETVE